MEKKEEKVKGLLIFVLIKKLKKRKKNSDQSIVTGSSSAGAEDVSTPSGLTEHLKGGLELTGLCETVNTVGTKVCPALLPQTQTDCLQVQTVPSHRQVQARSQRRKALAI